MEEGFNVTHNVGAGSRGQGLGDGAQEALWTAPTTTIHPHKTNPYPNGLSAAPGPQAHVPQGGSSLLQPLGRLFMQRQDCQLWEKQGSVREQLGV